MGSTVGELQERMTASEFVSWQAFYCVEPFGEARGDLQAAIIASTIANAYRKKGRRAFAPSDFLVNFWVHSEPASWQSMLQTVVAMNTAMGGRDNRKK